MLSSDDRAFMDLVRAAADRYRGTTLTAWQFARGKLWNDRVYRRALCHEQLPSGGTLLDLAGRIHRELPDKLKSARVWGTGVFDGQTVPRDHVLHDRDVVEIHVH